MRSFVELRGVDPGFEARNVLTAEIGLPPAKYGPEMRIQFFEQLAERVGAFPGVQSVGLTSQLPIRDPGNNVGAWDPDQPPADASEVRLAFQRTVIPGYFEAMDIPVRAGRDVRRSDVRESPLIMVINETMARTLFAEQDPLGRQVAVDMGGDEPTLLEVVGVVGDVKISSLSSDVDMVMYFAYGQRPLSTMRLAVRTAGSPSAVVGPLRNALTEMDRDIPLAGAATMDDVLADSVSFTRTIMGALGLFAAVALFLAALGLYGVLEYYVARRRHEIGIRMALGAKAEHVFHMILKRGFALVATGIVLGVAGALGAGRFLQELLFQVETTDFATFLGVTVFFGAVALLACLIPARRALGVDPVVAFRAE
jgi:putative ABC transport system permease protein